jgi:hypothetical protein
MENEFFLQNRREIRDCMSDGETLSGWDEIAYCSRKLRQTVEIIRCTEDDLKHFQATQALWLA